MFEDEYIDDDFLDDLGWDNFDDAVEDIDFSSAEGSFKKKFSQVGRKIKSRRGKPLSKNVPVKRRAKVMGGKKQLAKVIVPDDRKVIVEGVSKFMLSTDKKANAIKQVGYHKGKKLKSLVLTFNNGTSLIDFDIEVFNPSAPLDYLYSTSLNLNDKIQVAGGSTTYSDVLFNILANPMNIYNAKFVFSGASLAQQKSIPIQFRNKNSEGELLVEPLNLDLKVDTMQVADNIVFFDLQSALNRPFIPDGMDVISYKVLAGMTVTMAFFYDQIQLKKLLWKDAANTKKLL